MVKTVSYVKDDCTLACKLQPGRRPCDFYQPHWDEQGPETSIPWLYFLPGYIPPLRLDNSGQCIVQKPNFWIGLRLTKCSRGAVPFRAERQWTNCWSSCFLICNRETRAHNMLGRFLLLSNILKDFLQQYNQITSKVSEVLLGLQKILKGCDEQEE